MGLVVSTTYRIKLSESRTLDVEAPDIATAERRARMMIASNPNVKLLSIHRVVTEDVVDGAKGDAA